MHKTPIHLINATHTLQVASVSYAEANVALSLVNAA